MERFTIIAGNPRKEIKKILLKAKEIGTPVDKQRKLRDNFLKRFLPRQRIPHRQSIDVYNRARVPVADLVLVVGTVPGDLTAVSTPFCLARKRKVSSYSYSLILRKEHGEINYYFKRI